MNVQIILPKKREEEKKILPEKKLERSEYVHTNKCNRAPGAREQQKETFQIKFHQFGNLSIHFLFHFFFHLTAAPKSSVSFYARIEFVSIRFSSENLPRCAHCRRAEWTMMELGRWIGKISDSLANARMCRRRRRLFFSFVSCLPSWLLLVFHDDWVHIDSISNCAETLKSFCYLFVVWLRFRWASDSIWNDRERIEEFFCRLKRGVKRIPHELNPIGRFEQKSRRRRRRKSQQ